MAKGNIKGITIDFDGNTTKLDKALSDVDKQTNNVNKELRQVDSLLKFNPGNTDLIAQKQQLLAKQIQNTSERLGTLKQVQAQVDAQFKSGDLGEEEYRSFQREVVATEGKLKSYQGQLSASKTSQAALESSTKQLGAYFEASGKSVDDYADILGPRLTSAIKEGRASSTQLNEAINKIGRTVTDNEEDFNQFSASLKKIDDGGSIDALKNDLTDLEAKSHQADDALDEISKNTLSEKLQNIGDGLSDAGAKVQEFGEKAVDSWSEMDDAVDNLTSKTGATGEAANQLSEAYEKVEASMAGSQMESEDLSGTMAALYSQFGLSGKALESTSEAVAKFSAVTGQSGTDAVDALHTSMAQFNVSAKEIPAVLDAFTAASQATGVPVADLEQSVSKAYPAFKQLGISLTDGIPMLAAWSKSGIDSSTVLKGMQKAFSATKDSAGGFKKGIADAFNGIKNAKTDQDAFNIAIETFGAKSGPQMAQAIRDGKVSLDDLSKAAGNTGGTVNKTFNQTLDPIDKANQASKKFQQSMAKIGGEILEQVAPAMTEFAKFIKDLVDGFLSLPGPVRQFIIILGGVTAVLGILAPIIATFVTMDTTISLVAAGVAAGVALIVMAVTHWGDIVNWLKGVWNGITSFFSGLWTGIQNVFTTSMTAISAFITSVWTGVSTFFTNLWTGIQNIFTSAVTGIVNYLQPAFDATINVIKTVWNGLKTFFSAIWDGIKVIFTVAITAIAVIIGTQIEIWKTIITTAMNLIKTVITTVWNAIKSFFGPILAAIGNVISAAWKKIQTFTTTVFIAIKSFLTTVWNAIKAAITPIINGIKTVITNVWNAIKSVTTSVFNAVKSFISSVWKSIKSAVTSAVNAAKSVVTSAWNGIKSITSSVFNAIKSIASSVWNGIKSTVSRAVNGVKSAVSSAWNAIKSVTSSVWNGIKNAISTPINAAKSIVQRAINAIKGFFNFHISWPHIPMPSFGISPSGWKIGDLLKGSIPHLSISWHAAGGIFNKPTLFNTPSGLHGVGEAGPEGVIPLNDKTFAAIGRGIADNLNLDGGTVINATVYGAITDQVARQWVEKLDTALARYHRVNNANGGVL
ncbi:phage tail tape measure protein [Lacticaseibacillus jixiensis]|uniref:phage tail tape measure protein n=1 Tax=Lacticaseibacillus jixiensis TaxID=3231926 RepID=UPI0036F38ECF